MRPFHREIPAFLSIDIEPAGFTPAHRTWASLDSTIEHIEALRSQFEAVSGHRPRFCWYVRMDPQITELHGRPDHVVVTHRDQFDALARKGDDFGSHVHAVRRDDDGTWVHDFSDPDFAEHCIDSAFDAHESTFGAPPLLHRYGAGHLDNTILDLVERRGVRADLTAEPGSRPSPRDPLRPVESGVDATPRTAPSPDCGRLPLHAYRPALHDFRVVGTDNRRAVAIIPITATALAPNAPVWRQAAGAVKHRRRPMPRSLYMSEWRDDPTRYWDVVERDLRLRARPHVSLGHRTDDPASDKGANSRRVLDALPSHPLAKRLRFVHPLDALPDLLVN